MKNIRVLSVLSFSLSLVMPALASVSVNNPSSGEQVSSPFKLSAYATTCSSENVTAMGYSFDSSSDTTVTQGQSIDESINGPSGHHTLHVKAWGKGTSCVADVDIDVTTGSSGSGSSGGSVIPANAIKVSNLESMTSWREKHDSGGPGSSTASMTLVSTPSVSGTAREFKTSFSNSGDERYSLSFADDTSSENFFYDTWVYVTSSETAIGNLEFDINQTMSDGATVMFGIICDGYSQHWAYTVNTGTASSPRPRHIAQSGTSCDPRTWTPYKWHHVQAYYSRNSSGEITYHSVWLDGTESQMNETVLGKYSLGWGPIINTQFQVDGLGTSSNTVYLSNLTISRW